MKWGFCRLYNPLKNLTPVDIKVLQTRGSMLSVVKKSASTFFLGENMSTAFDTESDGVCF
jgi:hypothetical protein